MSRQTAPDTVNIMLSDRAKTVVAHLLTDPYGDHTLTTTATATRIPQHQVLSVFSLLVAQGWAIWRDQGVAGRPLALTSAGREGGRSLAETGDAGVPLAAVDREDPRLADRVRAMMGWEPRHP